MEIIGHLRGEIDISSSFSFILKKNVKYCKKISWSFSYDVIHDSTSSVHVIKHKDYKKISKLYDQPRLDTPTFQSNHKMHHTKSSYMLLNIAFSRGV